MEQDIKVKSGSRIVRVPVQGEKSEAARVIFLGWPGQHELDDEEGPHTPPGHGREASLESCLQLPPLMSKAAVTTAQPPLALNADCVRAQNGRQLGCARSYTGVQRFVLIFVSFRVQGLGFLVWQGFQGETLQKT